MKTRKTAQVGHNADGLQVSIRMLSSQSDLALAQAREGVLLRLPQGDMLCERDAFTNGYAAPWPTQLYKAHRTRRQAEARKRWIFLPLALMSRKIFLDVHRLADGTSRCFRQ
jgi:hypothetical protein